MDHSRVRDNRRYNEDNESQSGSSGNESSDASHSPVTTSPSRYAPLISENVSLFSLSL